MLVFLAAKSPDNTAQLPLPPATNPSTGAGGASGDSAGKSDLSSSATTPKTHTKQHTAKPTKFTVVISAAGDSCVTTHVGSMTGPAAVTEKGTTLANYLLQAGIDATIKIGQARLRRVRRARQHQRHHDQRQDRADALHPLGPGHEDHRPPASRLRDRSQRGHPAHGQRAAARRDLRPQRVASWPPTWSCAACASAARWSSGTASTDIARRAARAGRRGRPGRHVRRPGPDPRRPHGRGDRRASPASAWCSTRSVLDTVTPLDGRVAARQGHRPRGVRAGQPQAGAHPAGRAVLGLAGTAPGLVPSWRGASVVVLPGVPSELRRLWLDAPAASPAGRAVRARAAARPAGCCAPTGSASRAWPTCSRSPGGDPRGRRDQHLRAQLRDRDRRPRGSGRPSRGPRSCGGGMHGALGEHVFADRRAAAAGDRAGAGTRARADAGHRRVLHGRAGGGRADRRSPGSSDVVVGGSGHVLQPAQGATCWASRRTCSSATAPSAPRWPRRWLRARASGWARTSPSP